MVTNNNNQVNLEQVCSLNIEQSRLLQKLVQKLYCKLGSPKHPKIHPWGKVPKIGVDV